MKQLLTVMFFSVLLSSCLKSKSTMPEAVEGQLEIIEVEEPLENGEWVFDDLLYVPIYSDIYVRKTSPASLLTATLSIRNTSYDHSLYVTKIDYFNTQGVLIRKFLEKTIVIGPMASVNYVIEKEDKSGGNGANFIVALKAKGDIKPIVQAISIGQYDNKSFGFSTDGYSVK